MTKTELLVFLQIADDCCCEDCTDHLSACACAAGLKANLAKATAALAATGDGGEEVSKVCVTVHSVGNAVVHQAGVNWQWPNLLVLRRLDIHTAIS